MDQHSYILCLGSNFERNLHIKMAHKALILHFPNIHFGEEMITEAIGEGILSPFSNQIIHISTHHNPEELRHLLKEIELKSGRQPEDKTKGIVKLDIDILMYDKQIIKAKDLERDFVQKGLKELEKKCADVF